MSKFNYEEYQNVVSAAKNGTPGIKVGFFKLANDGDEALVRINCSSVNDLDFASVHTISAEGKWLKVSCLNPLGNYNDNCELCTAVANGHKAISKAQKKVYIQMLASYKDKATGTWSDPVPVIWERPASYSRDIANKLKDYGDLKQTLLKITRNGVAGDMKTTYSLDYAVPTIFKPEMIPMDFSAFNNFNIAKHSYWEKTAEEVHTYLTTGAFPEIVKPAAPTETAVQATTVLGTVTPAAAPVIPPVTPTVTPTQPVTPTVEQPATRNFGTSRYSF